MVVHDEVGMRTANSNNNEEMTEPVSEREIKSELCYYAPENPNNNLGAYEDEDYPQPRNECSCDNCFYGRDKLAMQLLQARDQRDRLAEELVVWKHEAEIVRAELKKADDAFESNISTYIDLRGQRDRLAEALQKVVTSWDDATWLDNNEFESFREALQYLTPNKP